MRTLTIFAACLIGAAVSASCGRSNNVLLGRVEAKVGSHAVVVTDCYRTNPPAPEKIGATMTEDAAVYHYAPCRDADIFIRNEQLTVNGKSYGLLKQGDSITVDHGKILINDREPRPAG